MLSTVRLVLALLILLARPAGAQELPPDGMSVVGLASGCRSMREEPQLHCREVIYSVMQTHALLIANQPHLAAYCPDRSGIDLEMARALFLRWEAKHRTKGAVMMPGAVGVLAALREAAPCP